MGHIYHFSRHPKAVCKQLPSDRPAEVVLAFIIWLPFASDPPAIWLPKMTCHNFFGY